LKVGHPDLLRLAAYSPMGVVPLAALALTSDEFRFLELVLGGADEDAEDFFAALIEDLLTGLVEVLGDFVCGGLLLVEELGDDAGALGVDGAADGADVQVEELRSDCADLAEVRNLAAFADEVAGLDGGSDFLGGLGEIVEAWALSASSLVFSVRSWGRRSSA
jgi:hypothetical protein